MSDEARKVVWNSGAERAYEKEFSESLRYRVDLALLEIASDEVPSDPKLILSPHGSF